MSVAVDVTDPNDIFEETTRISDFMEERSIRPLQPASSPFGLLAEESGQLDGYVGDEVR